MDEDSPGCTQPALFHNSPVCEGMARRGWLPAAAILRPSLPQRAFLSGAEQAPLGEGAALGRRCYQIRDCITSR